MQLLPTVLMEWDRRCWYPPSGGLHLLTAHVFCLCLLHFGAAGWHVLVGPCLPNRNIPYSNAGNRLIALSEAPWLGNVCDTTPFGMAGLPGYLVFLPARVPNIGHRRLCR